jgi:hypothetical protein
MAAVNPSLFNSIFSATYAYAPDVSGGNPYFHPQINIRNVHSLEVDTLTSAHITQGDVSGNLFFGNDAGQGAFHTSNCTSLGVNTLYNLQTSKNVTALGFESLYSANNISNVVAVGVNVGFDGDTGMQSVSDSVFIGDGIGLALSNAHNEIVIGTNSISKAVTSGGGNILIGVGAFGSNTNLGSSNVVIGTNAGTGTVNAPKNCIFIGHGAVATGNNVTSNYLNIGNTIYGNTSNKHIGIGKIPSVELDVEGTIRSTTGDITILRSLLVSATELGSTLGNITTVNATTVSAGTLSGNTVNATSATIATIQSTTMNTGTMNSANVNSSTVVAVTVSANNVNATTVTTNTITGQTGGSTITNVSTFNSAPACGIGLIWQTAGGVSYPFLPNNISTLSNSTIYGATQSPSATGTYATLPPRSVLTIYSLAPPAAPALFGGPFANANPYPQFVDMGQITFDFNTSIFSYTLVPIVT